MSAAEVEEWADWCEIGDDIAICGTRMKEASRKSVGERWCFHCRKRHNFDLVVRVPDGLSYYGPEPSIDGIKGACTDLFPGWSREWEE